ncbi:CYTH domain-containing protein [Fervidibacillus albus]|uniref:CYTH domain-containing protein n=1 Tax=Fervidibacillus albus TaxID=2980026 RepID=A0A9E8LSA8_9BACI|nr:CYTH domain-containing protein [Fervidibacillus albus]WAA08648.1 CYTH domain-containing protein [Fervidibacillus albus]
MQHVEIEFKNLLTKQEFDRLKNHFSIQEIDFFCQVNNYFDTPDFLLKTNGMALRIRKKNNSFELTLKEPNEVGLLETNEPIAKEDVQAMLAGTSFFQGEIKTRLEQLNIRTDTIVHFGQLTTFRAEFPYRDGLAVLDKNLYFKMVDYELEYEVTDEKIGEKHFTDLLHTFQIPRRKTENKIVRFYKEKMRQQSIE